MHAVVEYFDKVERLLEAHRLLVGPRELAFPRKRMRLLPERAPSGVRASCSAGPLDLREAACIPKIAGPTDFEGGEPGSRYLHVSALTPFFRGARSRQRKRPRLRRIFRPMQQPGSTKECVAAAHVARIPRIPLGLRRQSPGSGDRQHRKRNERRRAHNKSVYDEKEERQKGEGKHKK